MRLRSPSGRHVPTSVAGPIWMRSWHRWSISFAGPGSGPSRLRLRSEPVSRSPQKNYLDRLLEPAGTPARDELDNPSRPATGSGSPLLTRANSLGRLASGELKQVTHVR